jgi:DNA-directed RNA polymerase specialized sigma24 family protein
MTPSDLEAAVVRAQHGDAAAVEEVLAAVQDNVHRLALRMTGCRDDALDATQEILIKVLTKMSTFTGDAAFTTWVHRVAVNHLLDRKRSTVEGAGLGSPRSPRISGPGSSPPRQTPIPSSTCWPAR